MPNADHDAACVTCAESVRLGTVSPSDAVALLRAFFVQHEGCVTSVDLSAYGRMSAAVRSAAG